MFNWREIMAVLKAKVIPNSDQFRVIYDTETETLKIKVKSKALKGKANQEIVKELQKFFRNEVMIIKGEKSNKKLISIPDLSEQEALEKLKISF